MILNEIIEIVKNGSAKIENGTLFCDNWVVPNKEIITYLYDNNCIENNIIPEDVKIGSTINIELSLAKLCDIGFYDSYETFVAKNKYELRTDNYYIYENDNQSNFISKYNTVQGFIASIKSIAKHLFNDVDVLNVVISNEKQSIIISCDYSCENVTGLDETKLAILSNITNVLDGVDTEKKNLLINELIDFVSVNHANQLSKLFESIGDLYKNFENAYAFYISGFSSNKLKLEINTKALEYTKKVQTVINEAQSRLIAIPSAFVLAALTLNYNDYKLSLDAKNVVTTISLFIFAVLIQLFISNQRSILEIIKADISDFKSEFGNTNIELLSDKFKCVSSSLDKQNKRLGVISFILWMIPGLTLLYLIISQFI